MAGLPPGVVEAFAAGKRGAEISALAAKKAKTDAAAEAPTSAAAATPGEFANAELTTPIHTALRDQHIELVLSCLSSSVVRNRNRWARCPPRCFTHAS